MIVEGVVLLTQEDNLMASCFRKDIFDPNVGLKLQKPQNTEQKGGHAKKRFSANYYLLFFMGLCESLESPVTGRTKSTCQRNSAMRMEF